MNKVIPAFSAKLVVPHIIYPLRLNGNINNTYQLPFESEEILFSLLKGLFFCKNISRLQPNTKADLTSN